MNWSFPDTYHLVPHGILAARLERLAQACRERRLAGILLTSAVDVYYLSGSMQQGVVLVEPSGAGRYFARRHAGRAAAESPLAVEPVKGLSQVGLALAEVASKGARIGLCLDVLPAREYLAWQQRLPGVRLEDVSDALLEQMGVKDAFEVEAMTRAGQLAAQVYGAIPGLLRPGVREAWLAGQLQALAMAGGHVDLLRTRGAYMGVYTWHVVSGPEGALPSAVDAPFGGYGLSPAFPQGASHKLIRPHEPVIVDFGTCLDGYQTDQTRTYCLGAAPHAVKKAHAALEAVRQALLDNLRPGAVSGELFDLAVETAAGMGMAEVFLGRPEQRIGFVAHGVGLELGTPPYVRRGSRERVRAGEAYALELKIVLEQGPVGLEDTVLVNPQGPPTVLTPMPVQLFELPM
ncbi:MAG: aminopeptidase P family protein [Desulfarculus sp.]|nr:aminopeptidase P family protein [Desulfarculus sp.]